MPPAGRHPALLKRIFFFFFFSRLSGAPNPFRKKDKKKNVFLSFIRTVLVQSRTNTKILIPNIYSNDTIFSEFFPTLLLKPILFFSNLLELLHRFSSWRHLMLENSTMVRDILYHPPWKHLRLIDNKWCKNISKEFPALDVDGYQ